MSTKNKPVFSTKALAYCALLAALSVVFARFIVPMPNSTTRFSIEQVPIFLAGMLFGPLAGGMVGFAADAIGTLFSGYGFNFLFSVPPILYGVFGGLYTVFFKDKTDPLRLLAGFLPPVILGSILYQSWALCFVYFSSTFQEAFLLKLTTRSIQFAVVTVLDVVIFSLLFKARLFQRLGLWPRKA